jgi:hypothetical protein
LLRNKSLPPGEELFIPNPDHGICPSPLPSALREPSESSANSRSAERIATEKRHLRRKWKAHIRFEDYKSRERVAIHAPRRQSLSIP